jgi:hypothetical protein
MLVEPLAFDVPGAGEQEGIEPGLVLERAGGVPQQHVFERPQDPEPALAGILHYRRLTLLFVQPN